jgi:hypothetical protein
MTGFSFIEECEPETPKKLKAAHAAIIARRERLNTSRAESEARFKSLQEESLSSQTVAGLEDLKAAKIVNWQAELDLRNAYDEWVTDYVSAMRIAAEKAFTLIAEVEKDIEAKLVAIGYVACAPTIQRPGKIKPGMIMSHPSCIDAKSRCESLKATTTRAAQTMQENHAARERTIKQMNQFRTSLASSLV